MGDRARCESLPTQRLLLISKWLYPRNTIRATCTGEAAASCILHTQLRSGAVGALDPIRHVLILAQSKVRYRLLLTGHLRAFRRRFHQTRFVALPITQHPWHTTR